MAGFRTLKSPGYSRSQKRKKQTTRSASKSQQQYWQKGGPHGWFMAH
jgi:hypothetical protein